MESSKKKLALRIFHSGNGHAANYRAPEYQTVRQRREDVRGTDELSGADSAPGAAERPIGAIGRIERAVETGADINVALLLAERLT